MTILKARFVFATADAFESKMYNSRLFKKYGISSTSSAREITQPDLAKQILLMRQTLINMEQLCSLDESKFVAYPAKININRNYTYLNDATKIFSLGLDTEEFERNLEELNDYISSHIFYQGRHKTFRTMNNCDLKHPVKDEDGRRLHLAEHHDLIKQKYDKIGNSFNTILFGNENEKEKI